MEFSVPVWLTPWLRPATLTGMLFWTLGFYLICGRWVNRWIDRVANRIPEAIASLVSTLPFLAMGATSEVAWETFTTPSWAISYSILTCAGLGVFRLGQLDNEAYEQKLKEQAEEKRKRSQSDQ